MGWGWQRCRYVLGSSLEPSPHHYSPAADDTDPLSNLSPGADRGRLPLRRMPDWYSPHPAPPMLNLHPPPWSTPFFYYPALIPRSISSRAQKRNFKVTRISLSLSQKKSLFQSFSLSLSHTLSSETLNKLIPECLCGGRRLKSYQLVINNVNKANINSLWGEDMNFFWTTRSAAFRCVIYFGNHNSIAVTKQKYVHNLS